MVNQLKKLFIFLALIQGAVACGQDVHFSQFYMAPLSQNPALAGSIFDLQGIVQYREQWRSIITPYTTIAASYDMRLNKKRIKEGFWAGGINFYKDNAGSSQMGNSKGAISIAYHVKTGQHHFLGIGLQGGFSQWSVNISNLQWGSQYKGGLYNAGLPSGEDGFPANSFSYIDAGAGVNWTYDNIEGAKRVTDNNELRTTLGFAVFNPLRPSYSLYEGVDKLYAKYVLHGNGLFSFRNSDWAVAPGFFFYRQGPSSQIFAGSLLRYKFKQESKYTGFIKGAAISAGGYYRAKDAMVAAFLLEISNYAIGFSYDINTSYLRQASGTRGGMEITIRFLNPNPFVNSAKSRF